MSDARELTDLYGDDYIDALMDLADEEHTPEPWEVDLDNAIERAMESIRQSDDLSSDEEEGLLDD